MISYDPFYKQVKAYRTSSEAFKDANYACAIEYGHESPTRFAPYFVAGLTGISLGAILAFYLFF